MKMRKIRYVQLGLILAFTLIVGTCLPPFISRIQERSLLDQEAVEEAEVVSVAYCVNHLDARLRHGEDEPCAQAVLAGYV